MNYIKIQKIVLLFCSFFFIQRAYALEEKKNSFASWFSSFFQQDSNITKEKKTYKKEEFRKKAFHPVNQKQQQEKIHKKNESKKRIVPAVTAIKKESQKQWPALHESIQETGYYQVNGNEKLKDVKKELWYTQAAWPFEARNFLKNDYLEVDFSASFADKAFFGTDRTTLSPYIFGKKTVEIQDFLLISRLLINNQILIPGSDTERSIAQAYKVYGKQEIECQPSFNSQIITINYARHWLDGQISTGIQIPIVRKSHHLKFSVPRNDQLEAAFFALTTEAKDAFLKENYAGVEMFVTNILKQKDITIRDHNDVIGYGDVTLFFNAHYDFAYCQESNVGLKLTLPLAKTRKLNTIWAPDLGNGGFAALTGFCAFQWHGKHALLNPHIHSELTYYMMGSVDRRVPRIKDYQKVHPGPIDAPRYDSESGSANKGFMDTYILYGRHVAFDGTKAFTESDSIVKELADKTTRIYMRPGVEWRTRIGNLFNNIIVKNLSCNIFYDVMIKASDSIGFYAAADSWDRDMLTKNTNQHAHRIGSTIHYQFDDMYRLNAGFEHLFAGKNIMQMTDFFVSFNVEF
jgi:hypothetical protein